MSQAFWTVTMFGAYLDLDDLAKVLPESINILDNEGAAELEEHVNEKTRLQSCAHMEDGQIVGIGIGMLFKDGDKADTLIKAIRNTEELASHLPKIFKKKKPQIIDFENSDDG